MEKRSTAHPVVLCVLDGWGQRTERADNAIAEAHTPVWDALLEKYPHGLLNTSGLDVGLPHGQMGNSEVGHMNLGAGRAVLQDLPRIDAAVTDGALAGFSVRAMRGTGYAALFLTGLLGLAWLVLVMSPLAPGNTFRYVSGIEAINRSINIGFSVSAVVAIGVGGVFLAMARWRSRYAAQ